MRKTMLRLLVTFIAVALSPVAMAAEEIVSGGLYVVTLQETSDAVAGSADELAKLYGGSVTEVSDGKSFTIRMPSSDARLLVTDPRVRSVVPYRATPAAVRGGIAAQSVSWNAGVGYAYDGSGNIKTIGSDSFVYDTLGRLVEASTDGNVREFGYDRYGNRTQCWVVHSPTSKSSCQYGYSISTNTNRISGVTYDEAGNLTGFAGHTYTYDALNVQTRDQIGTITREYVYSATDERIAVYTANQDWRWTVRDSSGKVLREFTSTDGPNGRGTANWRWAKDYVWRDGLLLATRQPAGSATTTYHYHLDHLGSPRRITNDSDQIVGVHDYIPFGPEASGGTNEPALTLLKYTGHERDVVGGAAAWDMLDYMHARYYMPALGRFLSVDPKLNVKRALRMPQNWNRYSYVMNNPLKYTDPTGEDVSIRLNFRDGNWSEEERKKIIAQVTAWYKAQNVGKVYVFDGSKANHGANFLTRLFSSGYATLAVSGKSGISRPHVVYTGQFSGLPAQQRLNAISNSVVHETAAHKFHGTYLEGSDGLAYSRGGLGGQDPQVRQRYGTVADSHMYDDAKTRPNVVNGPIPIHLGDQRLLRQQVGPHVEVEPPDDID